MPGHTWFRKYFGVPKLVSQLVIQDLNTLVWMFLYSGSIHRTNFGQRSLVLASADSDEQICQIQQLSTYIGFQDTEFGV